MRRYLLIGILFFGSAYGKTFFHPLPPTYNWSGFYLGITAGDTYGFFNATTTTQPNLFLDAIQANAVNNAGSQHIYSNAFITGLEGGYNWQVNNILLGLESDLQTMGLNGFTLSPAISYPNRPDFKFALSSYANANWLMTLRPRVGVVFNNFLFYVTGGPSLTWLQGDFLFTDNQENLESRRTNQIVPGYVVGTGIETALTRQLSVKAEYLFNEFSLAHSYSMNDHYSLPQNFSNSLKLKSNMLRFGLNYHFNQLPQLCPLNQSWNFEVGIRPGISSGYVGAPQPLLDQNGTLLISRLTYKALNAYTAETFGRIDHPSGVFVKGNLGAGTINSGELHDEDFPAEGAYSNTLSKTRGSLAYANADLGYDILNTPRAQTGVFVGYNYYAQNIGTYGCKQLAGSIVCVPTHDFDNFLGIAEQDRFNALRLGLITQFMLNEKLSFSNEAAYLPLMRFNGRDNHNARQLLLPEQSSNGDGIMLESILNYQIADCWKLGLGARYWAWNMHSGSVNFKFLGTPSDNATQAARYNSERYGLFLQASYHSDEMIKSCLCSTFSWQGLFLGGHLGGGWANHYWSDPFGPTLGEGGLINVAGFGDQIHATGPLGGANIGLNWQTRSFVYGLSASASKSDIRGENTLFSGLGGTNGQAINNYLATVVAKIGFAYAQTLFYIDGGSAMLNTTYDVNGNNNEQLALGTERRTLSKNGWTAGAGIEYGLTQHWTSGFEYNYIDIPRYDVSFPSIALINAQRISIHPKMNIFKLSLNYKFDCFK